MQITNQKDGKERATQARLEESHLPTENKTHATPTQTDSELNAGKVREREKCSKTKIIYMEGNV